VPLVEIYVLIEVGTVIGALPTIALCVLTAVVGAGLLRVQGFQTMRRAQENLNRGEIPAIEMFEGVALAFGGALLLTPGFLTDAVGFLCLVPWTRRWLIRMALARMQVQYGPAGGPRGPGGPDRRTIEGRFQRRDDD
ncbi:MAG: FxsA family protein, partial [Halofilum sp. (in: g-proteobacteria)]|nr:FxsA family protein [Halofilum sp. (in: g-proteobacteria)]